MNINDLTIGQAMELSAMFGRDNTLATFDNGLIGTYVIVRCRDAGVHAGFLVNHNGRECVLRDSRRLWYWKPAKNKSFLSGVAVAGLHSDSKTGTAVDSVHLTENCEIIKCTADAAKSIQQAPDHDQ